MATRHDRPSGASDLKGAIARLAAEDLRRIVASAAERHDDVARAVRLAAARDTEDLGELKAEIDRGLRTRRFLGYRESNGWAIDAQPVVTALREAVATQPSATLVALIERAIGHVVRVILKADDSDGAIGDVARSLLEVHAVAARASTRAVASPQMPSTSTSVSPTPSSRPPAAPRTHAPLASSKPPNAPPTLRTGGTPSPSTCVSSANSTGAGRP